MCYQYIPRFTLTAAFPENVLPVMSPTLHMAAFAKDVLPEMSPTLHMVKFADDLAATSNVPAFHTRRHLRRNVLPVMPPFFTQNWLPVISPNLHMAAFAGNVLQVMSPT